jgi:hypothetical protein
MVVDIELLKMKFRPYLEDGIDDHRGIADFRITLTACYCEDDFNKLLCLLTEGIRNTVNVFERSVNIVQSMS